MTSNRVHALLAIGRDCDRFLPPDRLERLRRLVQLHVPDTPLTDATYQAALTRSQAEIVVTGWRSPYLSHPIFAANGQLRYLCHVAGSVRSIVARSVLESGLRVTNWGGAVAPTVAEAALLGILSCLRRTTYVDLLTHRDRGWLARSDRDMIRSLFRRRVGLHGFGQTARALVTLLAPFGCDVTAFDPYVPSPEFERHGVTRVLDVHALYSTCDIISIHCSATRETTHVVGAALLAAIRDGGVLINTARAAIVDTEALLPELRSGRLYASLDVFDEEPLPATSPLRGLPNCQLTCHSAGPTADRIADAGDLAIENIRRYVERAGPLAHVVDVDRFDQQT